jgi:S-DNA-T family DNA segregation ATPase FtsK/SpoIIIE
MTKRIECTLCAGMGKRLIKKLGVVKMVRCKQCEGKGKVVVKMKVKAKAKPIVKMKSKSKTAKPAKTKLSRAIVERDESDEDEDEDEDEEAEITRTPNMKKMGPVMVHTRDLVHGVESKTKNLTAEQQLARETIEERAAYFGCPGKVRDIRKGPVITLYEFQPAKSTRVKRLINLQEDLALALSAEAVMVRRVPGSDVMGIEISNESSERQNVAFRASLKYVREAKQRGMVLPLNLGTDPFGEPIIDDLAAMPHLLIAGSTGSGKSVSLNCIISSLITVCSPDELEFYMIDPKGVELTHYNGIPHMKVPMVTSPHYAKDMLEKLIVEMRRRLMRLAVVGVRDLGEYNDHAKLNSTPTLPRIVVIIDELGDLMMQDRKMFTALISEISQIARATGIHMICATQRPSVDVLSGRIKVNFPGRMAFKVTSATDSRVIVHRQGAERLLGRGDMLYQGPTRSTLIRIHAPWVPIEDVRLIAGKLREIEEKRLAEEAAQRLIRERERQAMFRPAVVTAAPDADPARTLPQGARETQDIDIGWVIKPVAPKKA